jgi:diguanylate cyclase (GGDEF)-like protein
MRRLLSHGSLNRRDLWASTAPTAATALGSLFLAGSTIGLVSMFLPQPAGAHMGALFFNISLGYAGGLFTLLALRHGPRWAFQAVLLAGTLIITRAIYYDGASYYSIWYVWVTLYSFYFFGRSSAVVHTLAVAVAYALVLNAKPGAADAARWLTAIATLLVGGIFIDTLVRQIRRQHVQAREYAGSLAAIVDAMHGVFSQTNSDETRLSLCETACLVASADLAVLWEPVGDGSALRASAVSGELTVGSTLALRTAMDGAGAAFKTGVRQFGRDGNRGVELPAQAGAISGAWVPVRGDERTVGVMAVYWRQSVARPTENLWAGLELLAAQIALALDRVDLLSRLEQMAITDDLTGLPNRRAWQVWLPREMNRAKRDGVPMCVAMIDLDGFKELNDERGHQAGDQILKEAASAWTATVRSTDMLARYGGDEFVVLLPGCDLEDAGDVVGRIISATPRGQRLSVGVARWDGVQSPDALLAEADARLYEAKRAGGGQAACVSGILPHTSPIAQLG